MDVRLRLLVESAGNIVRTVDMEMRPPCISSSVRRHLAYTREEATRVRTEDVFAPDSYQPAMEVLAEEIARDQSPHCDADRTRTIEVDLVHRDGQLSSNQ